MNTTELTLTEIYDLAHGALANNGCDAANADAVARTIAAAERDGARSHGLFRVPGYVTALRAGRVRGDANPTVTKRTAAFVHVDGAMGFAPLAIERGIPELAGAAHEVGVAVMTITDSFHFAALWPEVEALAAENLVGLACVNFDPTVAPYGGDRAIFGTNPLAYAWPRPGGDPVVADMATAAMSNGDLRLAAQAGERVGSGVGLGPDGAPSTDPARILEGVQLPFGGHKGSAIALLVELLAAAATGDTFSDDATKRADDGGPTRGGEFVLALAPDVLAGPDHGKMTEGFIQRLAGMHGVRLPGARRHARRREPGPRTVDAGLVETIRALH
jgi:delta1-piperideine-2-carboxylate reductase